jgi:hypothetical protein
MAGSQIASRARNICSYTLELMTREGAILWVPSGDYPQLDELPTTV